MSSLIPTFDNKPLGSSQLSPNAAPFQTPWLDYSTVAVPDNHELVMWWSQYMWLIDGNYRTAMERVAAHFMTTIQFPDLEPDEESAWKDLFETDMDYQRELMGPMYDYLAYGNSFVSLYLPFKRFMRCPKCHSEQPIERVQYQLEYSPREPYLIWRKKRPCDVCGSMDPYKVQDRRDPDLARVRLNRYDPADIEIAYSRFSQRKEFYWKIPEEVRRDILTKARIHIDDTPIEVLEAVAAGGRLRFNDDIILHQDEQTVSGVRTRGWGIPRTISNFRTAWLNQLINKLDQATVIDYTMGLRTISPTPTPGGQDPMITTGMENFTSRVRAIIHNHRNNPAGYAVTPYPLEYQFLGGEGGDIMPPEKIKFRQQEYLNQLGVPLEYHQMNLSVQAAPMSLRLFENYWYGVPKFYNKLLDFIVSTLSRAYNLPSTKVLMQKPTIADDMERKAVLLQLMSANQLSPQTALEPFGINAHEEVKKVFQHQDYVGRIQAEYDEQAMQQQEMGVLKGMTAQPTPSMMQQQAGGMPGGAGQAMSMGGMPMGGMPGPQEAPTSLTAMSEQAQALAEQLSMMDDYSRKQELKALRDGNKDLHALVMQNLEDIRSAARSQGQQMLLGPQQPM